MQHGKFSFAGRPFHPNLSQLGPIVGDFILSVRAQSLVFYTIFWQRLRDALHLREHLLPSHYHFIHWLSLRARAAHRYYRRDSFYLCSSSGIPGIAHADTCISFHVVQAAAVADETISN
jgi:hypothetical protein